MEKLKSVNLFDMEKTIAAEVFSGTEYPWEILGRLSDFIVKLGESLNEDIYEKRGENIWVAKNAKVAPTAYLNGPLIICENAEIRHCAFIRGSAIVGRGAVVGNSTEIKNALLFDEVEVPHYNYVGDSVLGYKAHMGAGAITSNLKADKTLVTVMCDGKKVETSVKKFGAMLGDFADIGCNSVLNPGTVIGRKTSVYPLSMVRGYVEPDCIYKNKNEIPVREIRDFLSAPCNGS